MSSRKYSRHTERTAGFRYGTCSSRSLPSWIGNESSRAALTGSRSAAGVTTTGCRTSGAVIRWHRRSRDRKKGRVALAGSLGAGRTGRVAADVLCWRHPRLRPAARNQEVQRDPNWDGRQSLEPGSDISSGNGNLCFCISLIIRTTYRDTLEARVGIEPTNKGFADLLLNRSNFLFVNDLLPRS